MLQALTLLTMAIQLLVAASNPVVPESLKQQAISIANFAIQVANTALKESTVASVSLGATSPTPVTVIPPPISPPVSFDTSVSPPPLPPQIIYVPVPTPMPSPPIPTVTLSLDKYRTPEGIYIVDDGKLPFIWNSIHANKCVGGAEDYASGYVSRGIRDPQKWGWFGDKPASGIQTITAQETGEFRFWIDCSNPVSSKSEQITIRIRQLSQ